MVVEPSEPGGHVDALAVGQRDDRLLDVLLYAAHAAEDFGLAFAQQRVDAGHLDVEELLDGRLDLRLGRIALDPEHDLVRLRGHSRLFGDHGRDDNVVMAWVFAHLNRASSASMAALVRTSFSRRMMS